MSYLVLVIESSSEPSRKSLKPITIRALLSGFSVPWERQLPDGVKVVASAGSRGSDRGLGTHGFTKTLSGVPVRPMLAAVCNAGFSVPQVRRDGIHAPRSLVDSKRCSRIRGLSLLRLPGDNSSSH